MPQFLPYKSAISLFSSLSWLTSLPSIPHSTLIDRRDVKSAQLSSSSGNYRTPGRRAKPDIMSTAPKDLPQMEYRRLGRSGLQVSAISLGGWLTYGGHVDNGSSCYPLHLALSSSQLCDFVLSLERDVYSASVILDLANDLKQTRLSRA